MNNRAEFNRWLWLLAILRGLYVAVVGLSAGGTIAAILILFTRKT